jgi:hypothetical protein
MTFLSVRDRRISFHPRAGIWEGVSADRPWPASSGLRSSVAVFASPDRRRENPSAISRALSPIAHKGACADDVTPAIADRRTSLVLMRLLHKDPSCRRAGCLISSLPPGATLVAPSPGCSKPDPGRAIKACGGGPGPPMAHNFASRDARSHAFCVGSAPASDVVAAL